MDFRIKRGINISHWLTDRWLSDYRRHAYITRRDLTYISEFGFDHVRIPIAERTMWSESTERNEEAFALLRAGIGWALAKGLRVIVNLYSLRSHQPVNLTNQRLFGSPAEEERFEWIWSDLSNYLGSYSNELVAYELLNEPLAKEDSDWNRVFLRAYQRIRQKEPDRTILLGSNCHQIPQFDGLSIPSGDPNIILTFHFYYPFLLTHHRAEWISEVQYMGPVEYPGRPVPKDSLDSLQEPVRSHVEQSNRPFNLHVIRQSLETVLKTRDRTGLVVHCGEFGCIDNVALETRKRWCRDVISNFDQLDVPWSYWDWKSSFGILDQNTWRPSGVHPALGLEESTRKRWQEPLNVDFRSRATRFARRLLRLSLFRPWYFRKQR